jgi:excisionase family DNA binding protein
VAERKFLTLAEAALVTGVAKRSLQRLVADGRLPVVRFGRCVRVPVAALDEMAAGAIAAALKAAAEAS